MPRIFNKIVTYAHEEYRMDGLYKQVEELPRSGTVIEMPRRA